jgi:hypothetical protein
MNPSQFVKYIADHPELKPSVMFVAHGYREAIALGPGPVVADFPRGRAFIFPDYFAFLTTRHFPGGMQQFEEAGEMFWNNFVIFAKTANKFSKWTSNPASIALDIAKALGSSKAYQEPKIIQKLLQTQGHSSSRSATCSTSQRAQARAEGGGNSRKATSRLTLSSRHLMRRMSCRWPCSSQ